MESRFNFGYRPFGVMTKVVEAKRNFERDGVCCRWSNLQPQWTLHFDVKHVKTYTFDSIDLIAMEIYRYFISWVDEVGVVSSSFLSIWCIVFSL